MKGEKMHLHVRIGMLLWSAILVTTGMDAQLVVDNGLLGLETDHTSGYLGTGVSFADFNGDGIDDLSFGHHSGDLKFYIGENNGFVPIDLNLETPNAESKGLLWADIDNDGDQDLFAAFRLAPNKLWIN